MATRSVFLLALTLLAVTSTATGGHTAGRGVDCRPQAPGPGSARSVDVALRAGDDVWGNALLRARDGPTYARARRYLTPLLLARGRGGSPLTESGFHYLAFTQPSGDDGSGSAALHVADGSQILSKRVGGRSLTIDVGDGAHERYGSCLARLDLPRLAAGYLPILRTRYVDGTGARYEQESFAGRSPDNAPLTSFVRIAVDALHAGDVEVRLAPSTTTLAIPARTSATLYVAWPHMPTDASPALIDGATYDAARARVVAYWEDRLRHGATIDVPEPHVRDAARNLLVQNLGLGWRYSLGNPYQQFSYPEALDVARVMSAYGFADVAAGILRRSLTTPQGPYPSWRLGQKLVATAEQFRLFHDRELLDAMTPELRHGVASLAGRLEARDLLPRERYSSDVPDLVYGLHAQTVAWQGLRAMGQVWAEAGEPALAARCRRLAARLGSALRRAVRESATKLRDGSWFLPVRLLDGEQPYEAVTGTRRGSYWNLVVPYALASGLFGPGSPEATGTLSYMLRHGSRLLGLVRSGAYSLYGRSAAYPASGVNPVYGGNVARFLADNDRPDQLVLSLYGQLAAGMTPGTFVAGEAVSVAPQRGAVYRSTYLPPNAAANASFLETLRVSLVHELRDSSGAARGLEFAFATPRAWLDPGKVIAVRDLPTSFGRISFTIIARRRFVRATLRLPVGRIPHVKLRLRIPGGRDIARVEVDGRATGFDRASGTIELAGRGRLVALRAFLESAG